MTARADCTQESLCTVLRSEAVQYLYLFKLPLARTATMHKKEKIKKTKKKKKKKKRKRKNEKTSAHTRDNTAHAAVGARQHNPVFF